MNIVDLLKGYRGAAGVVRPLDLETDTEIYGNMENVEACKKKLESIGGSIENVYVTDAALNNIYYVEKENGVYLELFPFCVEYMDMMEFEQRIPVVRKSQLRYLNKHKYSVFYSMIPECMKVYDFQQRYLTIPQDKVTKAWLTVYTNVDYGFSAWDKDVIKYVINHAPSHNKKGYYTIYRGEGTTSTCVENSFSWTTDFNTALFFAAMWEGKRIWKANVKAENIVFFIDERDEHEVIIAPDNIENLEEMDIYSGERESVLELLYPILDDYKRYGEYIPQMFEDCHNTSTHGESHTARVLANALLIAEEMDSLSDSQIEVLAMAAVFHDCGRLGDSVETGHGKRSAEIALESEYVKAYFNGNDKKVLSAIISCHDIDDEKGEKCIEENVPESYKETAKLLYYILKDADALDRYRLSGYRYEFDYNLLRLEGSKRLPLVTAAMKKGQIEKIVLGS